jgi:hypothetical protein
MYTIKKMLFLICVGLCGTGLAFGQDRIQVNGTITVFENYPICLATIRSVKSGNAVKSDSTGHFSISCHDNDVLLCSAAGFIEQKVRIRDCQPVLIRLSFAYKETSYDEAVIQGHLPAPVLKHFLDKYPAKGQKDYSRYQNIYELIRSEFSILRVSGTEVLNNKTSSFALSSQVLYVVDDMVVTDISFVRPGDVKTIEFLDDSYATAYGMRGGNGVLKITLRKE